MAHDNQPAPGLTERAKQVITWLTLITVLGGGIAWLFSIKEAADESVRISREAKDIADKTNAALAEKADKADVRALHEDLQEIKRDVHSIRFGNDVTVRHIRPTRGTASRVTASPNTP